MKINIKLSNIQLREFLDIDAKAWAFSSKVMFEWRNNFLVRSYFISLNGRF